MADVNVSILIGTFGSEAWRDLAWSHAYPSAVEQGAHQVLVLHGVNVSLARVRNLLAEEATGDWLCFLDADDELEPGYLDAMRAALPGWAAAHRMGLGKLLLVPAVRYIEDSPHAPRPVEIPWDIPAWGRDLLDVNCAVIGTLIPRSLFLQVGGFRERLDNGKLLTALEDWDLWLRAVLAGATLVPVPQAVYRARVRSDGRNRDQSLYRAIRAEHEQAWRARAA